MWDDKPKQLVIDVEMTGPDIIEDEVEEVIRKIKAGKIRGEDLGAMKMM